MKDKMKEAFQPVQDQFEKEGESKDKIAFARSLFEIGYFACTSDHMVIGIDVINDDRLNQLKKQMFTPKESNIITPKKNMFMA